MFARHEKESGTHSAEKGAAPLLAGLGTLDRECTLLHVSPFCFISKSSVYTREVLECHQENAMVAAILTLLDPQRALQELTCLRWISQSVVRTPEARQRNRDLTVVCAVFPLLDSESPQQ